MVTSEQIKMARAALGWSVEKLAQESVVGVRTIHRIEAQGGLPNATSGNLTPYSRHPPSGRHRIRWSGKRWTGRSPLGKAESILMDSQAP